jgi:hypothetical protein
LPNKRAPMSSKSKNARANDERHGGAAEQDKRVAMLNFHDKKRAYITAECEERGIRITRNEHFYSLRATGIDLRVIDLNFLNAADLEPCWLPARPTRKPIS